MQSKKLELSESELNKLVELDRSLQHWSLRHAEAALQVQGLLANIQALSEARKQTLSDLLSKNDVDPNQVLKMSINPEGKSLDVLVQDPQEE